MVGKLLFVHLKSKKFSDVNPIGKGNTTKYHLCAETPCAAPTLKFDNLFGTLCFVIDCQHFVQFIISKLMF